LHPSLRHAPWQTEHERRDQHDDDSQKDYNQVCENQQAKQHGGIVAMRAGREKKKLRLNNSQSLTPRERELLALFRVMTEGDRQLLLSAAERVISTQAASGSGTP
jgi:hypothetical protein